METATQIAQALGNDGTNFETDDGTTLETLCQAQACVTFAQGDSVFYRFADGSVIGVFGCGAGWDTYHHVWLQRDPDSGEPVEVDEDEGAGVLLGYNVWDYPGPGEAHADCEGIWYEFSPWPVTAEGFRLVSP